MGVEILVAAGLLSTAASVGIGVANYEAGQDAARAAKNLSEQQAAQLDQEAKAREAEATREAGTGAVFGRENDLEHALKTGFGFGNAPGASPNGRNQITGLG